MKSKSKIETAKFHFRYFLFETLGQPEPTEMRFECTVRLRYY
jgi:hypothetical protein